MKEVFISYAHDNLNDREELIKHLTVLKRQGLISDWSDKKLIAGEDWDQVIKKKLDDADIVVFLVSSEFLASDYINTFEVEETLKKHHENTVQIFPIILNNCMWQQTKLNSFQAVPSYEGRLKPISEWADKNKAYYTVSIELMRSIKGDISDDSHLTKIYDYKKAVSKWERKANNENSPLSLDHLFKLLLITFLIVSGIGLFL
ncbi:hypothetical protein A9996_08985 [Gelidibacter algens]|uniref:toll/interleukin-1 receptor domain-containing protein n=1 Tax=Gelidibacter algens TaxID=49280 RepID=UPI000804C505|nr:toll/interleukin-1 receptor domain-containing protein [Gelidibacter algens]OBX25569.1 hypothetical protein A9996_08985 [Gelidibacter algens]